ncbi:hypothetical protein [Actinomycetospora atypica]|uniref:Capsular polysaccharide biosynthesis protein n=1 Tax=Actinomycetospora atypica TaxID=1290095 RepID=A0ABV9YJY3_9PSEU
MGPAARVVPVAAVLVGVVLGLLAAGLLLWALPARHAVSQTYQVVVAPGVTLAPLDAGVFDDASVLLGGVPRPDELAGSASVTPAGDVLVVRAEGASSDEATVVAGAVGTAAGRRLASADRAGRPVNRPTVTLVGEAVRDEGSRPPPAPVLVGGAVVGLAAGLLVAVVRSRRRGRSPDLPVLGRLPRAARDPAVCGADESAAAAVRAVLAAVRSAVGPTRVVAVVAVEPQSGPVSAAAELATALADAGEQVLLVESGPGSSSSRVRRVADPTPGIREVLSGSAEVARAVRRWERGGIDVLPTGRPGPPLAGADVARVLDALRERYDRIVLDAPGEPGSPAAAELARAADASVWVVRRRVHGPMG